MNKGTEKRVMELAGLLCDDLINDEQFAELDHLLAADAEARDLYRGFLGLHQRLEGGALKTEGSGNEVQAKVVPFRKRPTVAWLAAAAIAVFAAISFAVIEFAPEPEPPIAVLTRAIDIEWEHPRRFQAATGEAIDEKWLRLKSGVAEVTFSSGATVSVEGPAQLRIDEPLHCFSKFGKLAANCPESAYGFTIRFRGGKVVDLGTEFALNTEPEGKTDVHVLKGEVIVALTDADENVLKEQVLTGNSAVALDLGASDIESIDYDAGPFAGLQREALIRSQPIKLQLDLGHRAGVYTGTDSPGHAAGDVLTHENSWTQIVGDQSGALVMADGNLCPHPIRIDYGHGTGEIDWDATPVDPWGGIYSKARGVFDSPLCQDHRPWDDDLGIRLSGLPEGAYRVYALCRSVRRPGASYDVSFGLNLDRQLPEPTVIPPMDDSAEPQWEPGLTYAVADVEVTGPKDWVTFITRYSRDRSIKETPHHGRSVLLGLQIVEIK